MRPKSMTSGTKYTFNATPPLQCSQDPILLTQEQVVSLPRLKYYRWDSARRILPDWFNKFLDQFPTEAAFKYCLLDVKPQYLAVGQWPCQSFWHTDVVDNPRAAGKDEVHYIYTLGGGCPTQFSAAPITLDVPHKNSMMPTLTKLQVPKVLELTDGHIHRYTRNHLHRCQPAKIGGWRLLVRKSYSDQPRQRG